MKCKSVSILGTIILISLLMLSPTYSHPQNCDPALQQNISVIKTKTSLAFAWLKIINEYSYSTAKKDAEIGYKDLTSLFTGDYNEFVRKRDNYFKSESKELNYDEARQELRAELSQDQLEKWLECIKTNSTGLFYWIENVDDYGATLNVDWKPARGLGKLKKVYTTLNGAKEDAIFKNKFKTLNGKRSFIFKRKRKYSVISGTINGLAGDDGQYDLNFYIPPKSPNQIRKQIDFYQTKKGDEKEFKPTIPTPDGYKYIKGSAGWDIKKEENVACAGYDNIIKLPNEANDSSGRVEKLEFYVRLMPSPTERAFLTAIFYAEFELRDDMPNLP